MWRRNALSQNPDSDQSISEEEDFDGDWAGNAVPLGTSADNQNQAEGEMRMLSKLEMLRDVYAHHRAPNKRHTRSCNDEVEDSLSESEDNSADCPRIIPALNSARGMLCLPTMPSLSLSDEEIISDNEKEIPPVIESLTENVGGTWSNAKLETEALFHLHENSGGSASHGFSLGKNKALKDAPPLYSAAGARTKTKSKFTFREQSSKEGLALVVSDGREWASMPDESGTAATSDMVNSMAESQQVDQEEESKQLTSHMVPFGEAHRHDFVQHSMAEFLDCFQERNALSRQSLKMDVSIRGRRDKMLSARNWRQLGHRNLDDDDDDLPEASEYSCSPIPIEKELLQENPRSLKTDFIRTMADQFHEAYGTVPKVDERSYIALPGSGLFGKLQQVMQTEKDRDMAYLKNLSADTDDGNCISVRILSKSLEAKLTVCTCSFVGHGEDSYMENDSQTRMKSPGRTFNIIFSPRICSDIELEVGSLICIHAPWKEIQVKGKDDAIILCSYFSQGQSS